MFSVCSSYSILFLFHSYNVLSLWGYWYRFLPFFLLVLFLFPSSGFIPACFVLSFMLEAFLTVLVFKCCLRNYFKIQWFKTAILTYSWIQWVRNSGRAFTGGNLLQCVASQLGRPEGWGDLTARWRELFRDIFTHMCGGRCWISVGTSSDAVSQITYIGCSMCGVLDLLTRGIRSLL